MRGRLTSVSADANITYIRGICIKKSFRQLLVLATICLSPLLRLLLILGMRVGLKSGYYIQSLPSV